MSDSDETIMRRPVPPVTAVREPLCSVGRYGVNRPEDVILIRTLLGTVLVDPIVPSTTDRRCDPGLIAAIETYQSSVLGIQPPSGRIDPDTAAVLALRGEG